MTVSEFPPGRAQVASLAHGLAHEVSALQSAHFTIERGLREIAHGAVAHQEALRLLEDMIQSRKGRIADMGAQVAADA